MLKKIVLYFKWIALIIYCNYQIVAGQQVVTVPEVTNLTYKDYRLEPVIYPENYKISIRLDEYFHVTRKFTIENCTIEFNVADSVSEKQTQIRIHYDLDYVNEHGVKLLDAEGEEIAVQMDAPKKETNIAVIRLQDDNYLNKDFQPYFLVFTNVKGTLRSNNNGFYLSQYQYQNLTRYIATTQFETIHARSAFPCFDEPKYKATFDISIKKPRNYTTVLSNAKRLSEHPVKNSNLTEVIFARTPKMSTYLVAFIVSTFDNLTDPTNSSFSIYLPEGHKESAQYALKISKKLAENLSNTTGLPYFSLGIPKLHHVAVPDFSAGAMENWGLMIYRESALLWDPKQSTNRNKQRVLTVVSHETSHSWFGDLVTLDWWSETWLNEGFATYFEYHAAANIETSFDLKNKFVYDVVQYVLEEDSISSSQPLSSKDDDVFTLDQINQKFGSISYEKGGSVIRMIEHIMTAPRFFAALSKYLNKHRYNNTKATDLFIELESEGLPKQLLESWIYNAGYPVVTVKRVNNDAVLTQQRFLLDEANSTTKWAIPISYASNIHNRNFQETKPTHWLNMIEDLVIQDAFKDSDWIVANIQQTGYYRVDYEAPLWEYLTAALKSNNFGGINPINRAQIIDDVMNMARIKKQPYKVAMDVTKYLEQDVDYYPWASALESFRFLMRHVKGDKELLQLLKNYLSKLSTNIINSVSFLPKPTDSHMTITKRVLVMSWASYLEDDSCVTPAKNEFVSYKANPEFYYVNPNVKFLVYCVGVKYGNTADWDFMYGQFLKANISSEREIILTSLGCSQDQTILTNYLQMSLNESYGIRRQDADSVLLSVISINSFIAFEFYKKNAADIKNHYASMNAISNIITSFAEVFTTPAEVGEFKKYILDNQQYLGDASGVVAENAVKAAESNLKWMASFGKQLKEWLKVEKAGAYAVTATFAILVVTIIVVLFY